MIPNRPEFEPLTEFGEPVIYEEEISEESLRQYEEELADHDLAHAEAEAGLDIAAG